MINKSLSTVVLLAVLFGCLINTVVCQAREFALVSKGKPACRLQLSNPEDPAISEIRSELTDAVKRISKVDLPTGKSEKVLHLPVLELALRKAKSLPLVGSEGFRINFTMSEGRGCNMRLEASSISGLRYGVYHLMELMGIRFLNPETTHYPKSSNLSVNLKARYFTPEHKIRGFQLDTLQATAWAAMLMSDPSADNQAAMRRYVDWVAHLRINLISLWLLDTDPAKPGEKLNWDDYSSALVGFVNYAHSRGVDVEFAVGFPYTQSNAMSLFDPSIPLHMEQAWNRSMRERLDRLLTLNPDRLLLYCADSPLRPLPGESVSAGVMDVVRERIMLTRSHLRKKAPEVKLQLCVPPNPLPCQYRGIRNYFHMPKLLGPEIGAALHTQDTVAFPNLSPQGDTFLQWSSLNFIRQERKKREITFRPATSQGHGIDLDVPVPMLQVMRSRGKEAGDLAGMVNGIVYSTVGLEWGYWMNDLAAARACWDPYTFNWRDSVSYVASCFENVSGDLEPRMRRLVEILDLYMNENHLGVCMARFDAIRNFKGELRHPDLLDVAGYNRTMLELNQLQSFEREIQELHIEFAALKYRMPKDRRSVYQELVDSVKILELRIRHARLLHQAAMQSGGAQLHPLDWPEGRLTARRLFKTCLTFDSEAEMLISRRQRMYLYPAESHQPFMLQTRNWKQESRLVAQWCHFGPFSENPVEGFRSTPASVTIVGRVGQSQSVAFDATGIENSKVPSYSLVLQVRNIEKEEKADFFLNGKKRRIPGADNGKLQILRFTVKASEIKPRGNEIRFVYVGGGRPKSPGYNIDRVLLEHKSGRQ
jgi:hypothetical protein